MGDHRASVTIDLEFPDGIKHRQEFWINYWPDDDGIDPRIKEFFAKAWDQWLAGYSDMIAESRRREQEALERKQLAALTAKYGAGSSLRGST